ncbi:hypothetical protein FPF71_00695 [Algibacter amylolyticus]|uniref:Uncharacterized protein n=1 Tax=Algibacter amylolyticus TaxID=1608400 RepID=A0A5M7BCG1_9FLAO|nr:DUF6168 family protein [Algibacter amylolyticus]KAA5827396.1 hypothetical protein F2B50_00695 [Algibacter amylolyticus]MBB5266587.1 hypothetical protein [Algibacter amylolyticus]TSJ81641.1 hypothetical protein FPF71_00695 [Algibacter amylolyticus]
MIKRIVIVAALFLLLFGVSYGIHSAIISSNLSYSLLNVYLFFAISAVLVYATVEGVFSKLPNQAGYAYLMMMCLKIGAFVLIFQKSIFSEVVLSRVERVNLVVPLFLFLIAEAVVVGKLLNDK